MVPTAAARHRVLLQPPPARGGLARVEDLRSRSFDGIDVLGGERGDAAEALEEVQGDAFSAQQSASGAGNMQEGLALRNAMAVLNGTGDLHIRGKLAKGSFGKGQARDYQRLACADDRLGVG